jgi:hypothetical protein
MLTFKLVAFKSYDYALKYAEAALFVVEYAKTLENIDKAIFVFIRITPFANQAFLTLIAAVGLNCSYYNRSETLKLYQTQKLTIKHMIISNPNNVSQILTLWNKAAPQTLAELKLKNEMPSS